MTDPLVWLPFSPDRLGTVPARLRFEVQRPGLDWTEPPESVSEVRFHVPPYGFAAKAVTEAVVARMDSLEVVQTLTAGVEHIAPYLPDSVTLCNARGVHDASTAELALTLMLASLRGIPQFVRDMDAHTWDQGKWPALADRQVLIVGYGSIGEAIEARLLPFETEVVKVARSARDGVHAFTDLPALLPHADVVVLVTPLTDETRGMVDATFLSRMKDGGLLVNVSRGGVVDQEALIPALESGRITAALDVVDPEPLPEDHPLWTAPGLLISPHVGGVTDAMWPRAYRLIRQQLERYVAGEPLANVMSGAY